MKKSIKLLSGGLLVAALIFSAFAFTPKKQNQNKDYLLMRVYENAEQDYVFIQVTDKNGKVEITKEKLNKTKSGLFENENGDHAVVMAKLINRYAQKGYSLSSSDALFSGVNGQINNYRMYTTLIFEK